MAELPMLWLVGPVTGLVQPIIGAISDGIGHLNLVVENLFSSLAQ